ncbi:MAG TPA: hypothetical protein DCS04_05360 [Ruminococcaceae bacterium]|nr:hypothetical protein [Oscillospiraceae bacterium]
MPTDDKLSILISDFFDRDDIDRLVEDTGKVLNCPLMVIDDTFHVAAHYSPDGFSDSLFDSAIKHGEITYEVGALISESNDLTNGIADYVRLEESPYMRRFAPLISGGIRLGYLICVDVGGSLCNIPPETFQRIENILAKQLFVEAGRTDLPFETAEEILSHLLDGGFQSQSYFKLQASSTYLADFHPVAFALIDLVAYHSQYIGKSYLKDELTYRFYESHPFLHKGKVFMFLHKGYDRKALGDLAEEFHLKIVISNQINELYNIPTMYNSVLEALETVVNENVKSENVFPVSQLAVPIMLNKIQGYDELISPKIISLADYDRRKGSQFCETLYYYLTCNRSLKDTCEALFTHRNTILYRIRKMKEDFEIPLEDTSSHFKLLLQISMILYKNKGPEFFIG